MHMSWFEIRALPAEVHDELIVMLREEEAAPDGD